MSHQHFRGSNIPWKDPGPPGLADPDVADLLQQGMPFVGWTTAASQEHGAGGQKAARVASETTHPDEGFGQQQQAARSDDSGMMLDQTTDLELGVTRLAQQMADLSALLYRIEEQLREHQTWIEWLHQKMNWLLYGE